LGQPVSDGREQIWREGMRNTEVMLGPLLSCVIWRCRQTELGRLGM